MKVNEIYVGANNGVIMTLANGKRCVAVLPVKKGEKHSYGLLDTGDIVRIPGNRIFGVGVPRFLASQGFVLGAPDDERVRRLADEVDVIEGAKLVTAASEAWAREVQVTYASQKCTYVPFNASMPAEAVEVMPYQGYVTTTHLLSVGFGAAGVNVVFHPRVGSTAALSDGWLVGPDGNPDEYPRNTEYGGPVELAVFIMCNCGMGELVGPKSLKAGNAKQYGELFPRGALTVKLNSGDTLVAGINAMDELEVLYKRDDQVIYARKGFSNVRLGTVVGAVAAVLIRVAEMDAAARKPKGKKKSA